MREKRRQRDNGRRPGGAPRRGEGDKARETRLRGSGRAAGCLRPGRGLAGDGRLGGYLRGEVHRAAGAHSDLHLHTNCETAVYVLAGRGYAYAGDEMEEYLEAGPGDFFYIPADLAHLVGCPAGGEPLEYIVTRNAPEEVVVSLRAASEVPIGPDGRLRDAQGSK